MLPKRSRVCFGQVNLLSILETLMARQWQEVRSEEALEGICQILDEHAYRGDSCYCGTLLDGTPIDPAEGDTDDTNPYWVTWIIHVKHVARRIKVEVQ
jgi:hypothetical protein